MAERLFDHDPMLGLTTHIAVDDDGDTWRLRYEQDATPLLDENKRQQAEGFDRRADMWHAAHIPAVVIMKWRNELGVDLYNPGHKEAVRKLLNDPEWRYLRTNNFAL